VFLVVVRRAVRRRADAVALPALLIVADPADPQRLVLRPCRPALRLTALWRATALDRQLAAGAPPETNVLLAIRAQLIASPAWCQRLASDWRHAVEPPTAPVALFSPRAPVCRDRIAAATPDTQRMLAYLVASGPKAARGVAMARLILSDARGPLFDHRCATDLATALRQAVHLMDPAAATTRWA
jgi:hypothetical protein